MPELPIRPPRRTEETAPFWDACAESRLVLPRCTACSELIWYPRQFCPFCGSLTVDWVEVSGRGTVYSFTIIRRGAGAYKEAAPYVVAYVELAEGPRLLTNIVTDRDTAGPPNHVTDDSQGVYVGQPVRVRFERAGDTDRIPRFEPA